MQSSLIILWSYHSGQYNYYIFSQYNKCFILVKDRRLSSYEDLLKIVFIFDFWDSRARILLEETRLYILIRREYEETFTVFLFQIILYSYLLIYSSMHVNWSLENDNRFEMISVNHDDDSLSWHWVSYKNIYIYICVHIYFYTFWKSKSLFIFSKMWWLISISKKNQCILYFISFHWLVFTLYISDPSIIILIRKIWMIIFYHFL